MTEYLSIIIGLFSGVFLLDTIADLLNLTRLKVKLPKEFEGIYDSEKYSECLKYQQENTRFGIISRVTSFIITLVFILVGGFNSIDLTSRNFHTGSLVTGLLFIGILYSLNFITQLPFSIYDTFILEEKYGFNQTSVRTFCLDILKGTFLGGIIGGVIFSGIVYFFETMGPYAWLYSWITFTVFQILLMYLAPALIMPLFNKFSPLPNGSLRSAIEKYAKAQKFHLNGIFTMDSSKRSSKSNAFFTGYGKYRRLVLFDTLISKHTDQELVAVLAHEIGHFKNKHILKSLAQSILVTGVIFFAFCLLMNNKLLFEAFKMRYISVYASVIFIGMICSPILKVLSIFTNKLSRKHEFEADAFAKKTLGEPEILVSALKKLARDNLAHLTPHPLKVALDYSHPPILERIHALILN